MVKVVRLNKTNASKYNLTGSWILTRVMKGSKYGRDTAPRIEMRRHLKWGTLLLITAKGKVHPKLNRWTAEGHEDEWFTTMSMNGALRVTPEVLKELAEASQIAQNEAYTLYKVEDIGTQYHKSVS